MDLTNLFIRNCLTIGHAEIALANRGLLLIQGENGDDTSATSNGSGKSSIVDALCWCVYGQTARDVSGDAVVNRTAKKDCVVETLWQDGPMQYKIQRHRKHKTHKNALCAWQVDASGIETDLTLGTERETQEAINRIMGCTLEVFVGAIYAGQEAMPDLPKMTDKQLKLLIEEAAGVAMLADAYAEAGRRATVADKAWAAAATHVKSQQQRSSELTEELADAQAQQAAYDAGRRERARVALTPAAQLERDKATAQAALIALDQDALKARRDDLNDALAAHRTQEDALAALARVERDKGDTVTRYRGTIEQLKGALAKAEQMAQQLAEQVGKPCGECGKEYTGADLVTLAVMRANGIVIAKKTLLAAAQGYKDARAAHEAAKSGVEAYRASMTDVTKTSSELARINTALGEAARLETSIALAARDILAAKTGARARMTEPNPWTKVVEGKSAEIVRLAAASEKAAAECANLEAQATLHANAARVFGPAGVRAHILDTVTPFLNEKTSDYLGTLSDGNITASWSTLAKNANGELREKFNIAVTSSTGGESFAALSGGEKRKVRISAALALQDMVAARAAKPIRLFVGDEIDDALDEPGLERLMAVLDKKAKECGTVLVISHNSLTDWCDNVITVTKSGGLATISGALDAC